uniref:Uncharacterized protein n=1 Tax=viral metagenome TaxID=1070528 RepID=A0A6C0E0Q4_9ZZZZ
MESFKRTVKKYATVQNSIYVILFIVLILFLIFFVRDNYEFMTSQIMYRGDSRRNRHIIQTPQQNKSMPNIMRNIIHKNPTHNRRMSNKVMNIGEFEQPQSLSTSPQMVSNDEAKVIIIGVTSTSDIWGFGLENNQIFAIKQVPGKAINVSFSSSGLFGVNSANQILHTQLVQDPIVWTTLPGSLVQISSDGKSGIIAGVNSNDDIYVADKDIGTSPNWRQVLGKLVNVAVSNGKLYGVNREGNIYFNDNYMSDNWVQINGNLKQVFFDDINKIAGGVNSNNDVYYASGANFTASDPGWIQITNNNIKISYAAISNNKIYGINSSDGDVYVYNIASPSSGWKRIVLPHKLINFSVASE